MIDFSFTNKEFQSTLPREERRTDSKTQMEYLNFNPRSHERSDVDKGAVIKGQITISIHAPTRGATATAAGTAADTADFNPRSHERSDDAVSAGHYIFRISIHAPTRGATAMQIATELFGKFQSTLPREERPLMETAKSNVSTFQSTLPREERRKSASQERCLMN